MSSGIKLVGHGSGFPNTKNMDEYLAQRYNSTMSNGIRKGLIRVRRMRGLTDEERSAWLSAVNQTIGRNYYSQSLREYVFTKYRGLYYYSDCSSLGDACFSRAGHPIGWPNTEELLRSGAFEDVPVRIQDGQIQNPEILRPVDILLFAGNSSRPASEYVGHVEYIYYIPGDGWRWIQDGDDWYYQDRDGQNAHGWRKIQERGSDLWHWYYFDDAGRMLKGLQEIAGELCVFMPDGPLEGAEMLTDKEGYLHVWDVDT